MKTWQAYFCASVVAFSAWLCRETLFEALQWWNGRPPSDGLLLGSYILLTGGACIPLVAIHFPHAQSAKRFLVLVVATGLLFVITQPPVKLSWVYRSELITAAHLSDDDTSIYGLLASKAHMAIMAAHCNSVGAGITLGKKKRLRRTHRK